jgi:hypothetical protein
VNESRIASSCPMTMVPIASRNVAKRVATQPGSLMSSCFMNQAGTGFQSAHRAHKLSFGRRRFVAHYTAPNFIGKRSVAGQARNDNRLGNVDAG